MRYLLWIVLLISSQAHAGFFYFKKRQPSIPIPPKEITFTHQENVKIPECDHFDKISCILDNAERFYPDKNEEQIRHIKSLMILKNYAFVNSKEVQLTESQIQDAFVEGQMTYESFKKKGIDFQSIEKWQRYFVGETVVHALNRFYAEK